MKNKTLILAIAIIFISVFAIGSASALDLFANQETVTIDGIDFKIPDGFSEDSSQELVNEPQSQGGIDYVVNGKTFNNGLSEVAILVADYGDFKVNDDVLKALGGEKTTLNDVEGYQYESDGYYIFNYQKNDKLVVISSSDENIISDFLIA